jgi:hypothetical protein
VGHFRRADGGQFARALKAKGFSAIEERTTRFGVADKNSPPLPGEPFADASHFVAFVRGSLVCTVAHMRADAAGTPEATLRARYSMDELRAAATEQYQRLGAHR